MCLIIFAPNARRARISKAVLAQGFDRNDDGAGFAYVQDGKVHVSKAYFSFDKFYADYLPIKDLSGPVLIHFRYGTKGSKCARNTQPLVISPNALVMAHNGVIDGLSQCKEDVSDSVKLARIIQRLDWGLPFKPAQVELLSSLCYDNSKLVFLDSSARSLIIHEDEGVWRRNAWYSDKHIVNKSFSAWSHRKRPTRIKKCVRVKPSKLLPPGTRFDTMNHAQKALVTAWQEARKVDPTLPPPWANPIEPDFHCYPRYSGD